MRALQSKIAIVLGVRDGQSFFSDFRDVFELGCEEFPKLEFCGTEIRNCPIIIL